MQAIHLYDAINQMRKLTALGKPFSFVHATYNRDTGKAEGVRSVRKAKLRPAAKGDVILNSQYKLFYYDIESQLPRNCWQVLIMFFNDKQVTLHG